MDDFWWKLLTILNLLVLAVGLVKRPLGCRLMGNTVTTLVAFERATKSAVGTKPVQPGNLDLGCRGFFQALMLLFMCLTMNFIPMHALAAKITVDVSGSSESCWGSINFYGEIIDGDAARLEKEILKLHTRFHTKNYPDACLGANLKLSLKSPGGSVLEGMALGRIARKYELGTWARECASSCVMVLAGGVRRMALGPVEVHQPFFQKLNPELTSKQIGLVRKELIGRISDYIEEMNVSPRLLDVMLSTPPEKTRALTQKELIDLRLEGIDPDFEERETAQEAYMYGVDSAQLRRGKSQAERLCKVGAPNFEECKTAAILQIPIEQSRKIQDRTDRCYPQRNLPQKDLIECLRSEYTRKTPLKTFTFKEAAGGN